ncbi:MAG: creatininase family protein [Polyangiales bacterium]
MSESGRTIPAPPIASVEPLLFAEMTTEDLARFLEHGDAVALVPIGSTEPHGPHLPLSTDALLSEEACRRAAIALRAAGRPTVVAPGVGYGVTRYAAGFRGAIGVSEATLIALLVDVGRALLDDGFAHVAFVNNHLEPEHVAAIGKAVDTLAAERGPERMSFPNQLGKRWGRTLTAEFKRGDCHAGRYETSLVMAARAELVRAEVARALPALSVSLSDAIRDAAGKPVRFQDLGMARAYTGAPASASREEGEATFALLVDMIVTEVGEHLDVSGDTSRGTVPSITPRGEGGPT